jgi:hypothetical protein
MQRSRRICVAQLRSELLMSSLFVVVQRSCLPMVFKMAQPQRRTYQASLSTEEIPSNLDISDPLMSSLRN